MKRNRDVLKKIEDVLKKRSKKFLKRSKFCCFLLLLLLFLSNKGVLKRSKDFIFIYLKRSKEFPKRSKFSKRSMQVSKRSMVYALLAMEFRRVKYNFTVDEFVEKLWSVVTVL